ncbi:hypothetical protein EVR82_18370, partial [Clostridioides difficile]|nr:hypothetical protein [Clostridioides difficile]
SFKNIKLLYIKISSIINYLDCYFDILYNITKADIKRQKGQFFYTKKNVKLILSIYKLILSI